MAPEDIAGVLLDVDPAGGAQLLSSMVELNITKAAEIIESSIITDMNKTSEILDLLDTQDLTGLLLEISHLELSPSTVATILESLGAEKSSEVVHIWISSEDLVSLSEVFRHMKSEFVNSLFTSLTIAEREVFYPHLSSATIAAIQVGLLPLPDILPSTVSISIFDSIGYTINAIVENKGNVETGTFGVNVYVNDVLIDQIEISELSTSDTIETSTSWRPLTSGLYVIEIVADPTDEIHEISEEDNAIEETYGVHIPDLTVSDVRVPTPIEVGNSYSVEVDVTNIGEEDAHNVNLTVIATGVVVIDSQVGYISDTIGSIEISTIAVGSKDVYTYTWEPDIAGAYTINAVIDPQGQIIEEEKINNEFGVQVEASEIAGVPWTQAIIVIMLVSIVAGLFYYRERILNLIG
jgi:hypothetical protein